MSLVAHCQTPTPQGQSSLVASQHSLEYSKRHTNIKISQDLGTYHLCSTDRTNVVFSWVKKVYTKINIKAPEYFNFALTNGRE